jgi:hypothetical protein
MGMRTLKRRPCGTKFLTQDEIIGIISVNNYSDFGNLRINAQ